MPRKTAAAIFCFFLLAWSAFQMRYQWDRAQWLSAREAGTEAILNHRGRARLSKDYARQAEALSKEIFPPNHAASVEVYEQGIRIDPLGSGLWFGLARERLLMGDVELARQALLRSDQLDPHYPRQRYEAIDLWSILENREHAVAVARQLGSLGGEYRLTAAKRLLANGMQPADVFRALNLEQLSGEEMLPLLEAMHVDDAGAMHELFSLVNPGVFDASPLRTEAARLASRPMNWDFALDQWKRENPHLEFITDQVAAHNLNLKKPAFGSGFYFGWQPVLTSGVSESRWIPPLDGDAEAMGDIEIFFSPKRTERAYRWVFYRLPLPKGVALDVSVRLRQKPIGPPNCWVVLQRDDAEVSKSRFSPIDEEWQTLELSSPAQPAASLIEIALVRETSNNLPANSGYRDDVPTEIHLGPLKMDGRTIQGVIAKP